MLGGTVKDDCSEILHELSRGAQPAWEAWVWRGKEEGVGMDGRCWVPGAGDSQGRGSLLGEREGLRTRNGLQPSELALGWPPPRAVVFEGDQGQIWSISWKIMKSGSSP